MAIMLFTAVTDCDHVSEWDMGQDDWHHDAVVAIGELLTMGKTPYLQFPDGSGKQFMDIPTANELRDTAARAI